MEKKVPHVLRVGIAITPKNDDNSKSGRKSLRCRVEVYEKELPEAASSGQTAARVGLFGTSKTDLVVTFGASDLGNFATSPAAFEATTDRIIHDAGIVYQHDSDVGAANELHFIRDEVCREARVLPGDTCARYAKAFEQGGFKKVGERDYL